MFCQPFIAGAVLIGIQALHLFLCASREPERARLLCKGWQQVAALTKHDGALVKAGEWLHLSLWNEHQSGSLIKALWHSA